MSTQPLPMLELRDQIAKAIADSLGHGMREKCERQADAVLSVVMPQLSATAEHAVAHLSAQAKVRVEEMVEAIIFHPFGSTTLGNIICAEISGDRLSQELANALKPFAARLSQGVQGEAVATTCTPVQCTKDYTEVTFSETDWERLGSLPKGTKLYLHPSERAAVPDGFRDVLGAFVATLNKRRDGRCLTIDHDALSELVDKANAVLTAAPQPPEGARVVDENIQQGFIECGRNPILPSNRVGCGNVIVCSNDLYRCTDCDVPFHKECAKAHFGEHVPLEWREALQQLVDFMHEAGMPCQRAEKLLAAPTLAGKERMP